MEFLSEKEDEFSGPVVALEENEIENMCKLANLSKRDVFFDLGCGWGEIVRYALKKYHVKESNGIEYDVKRFLLAIELTRDEFSKNELKKIEFWRSYYQDFDCSKATVIYNGLYTFADSEEIEYYEKISKKKSIKIMKRDLPLYPYQPIKVHRDEKGSWFFLMKTPLHKYRIKDKTKWAQRVLGKSNVTIYDVYDYYYNKLYDRFLNEYIGNKKGAKKVAIEGLRDLKKQIRNSSH